MYMYYATLLLLQFIQYNNKINFNFTLYIVHVHIIHVLLFLLFCFIFLQWCLYLQDCVVRQVYNIAGSERNQQSLCQVCTVIHVYVSFSSSPSSPSNAIHFSITLF